MAALRNRKMGNILNLVFDNWDDSGNPLPNLKNIQNISGNDITYPIFFNVIKIPDLEIKAFKLNEINKNENFYYVISHICSFDKFFKKDEWVLSSEVEYNIKNNNLKIIFLSEHESYKDLKSIIIQLKNILLKKELNENQFYIINNNSFLYDIKKELNTDINVYKINFLLESVSCSMNTKMSILDLKYEKPFTFLCHNRRPKNHRVALLTHLKYNNILENNITDWSLTYGLHNNKLTYINEFQTYINFTNKKLFEDYKTICSKPKLSFYEENYDWFDDVNNYDYLNHLELKSYQNSYINIVTESHFDIKDVHITEKSFKPFYYFQLPIFLASQYHVKKIKEEYELNLFEDLINHSYDNEENDIKRLHMVIDEIKRLSSMKDEIAIYYKNNIDKLLYNHNIISNYYNKNKIANYFISLSKN